MRALPTWGALVLAFALHGQALAQSLPSFLFKPELLLPRQTIAASPTPTVLPQGPAVDVGAISYTFMDRTRTVKAFMGDVGVKSFMVLKDGQVVYEYHRFPYGQGSLHQSWSIMKQVLSALVGAALQDGHIRSIDDPMDRYEPRLAVNGFKGVTFKQALTMSSGVQYDEVNERFRLFFEVMGDFWLGGSHGRSLHEDLTSPRLVRSEPPGLRYSYAGINSQALAWALEAATRTPLHTYLQQRLWAPLGMPDAARLMVDREGRPFAFCCLYATARSYARLGQLYAQGGQWAGRQVLPADWVRLSTTWADPAAWQPQDVQRDGSQLFLHGFAYHWWPLKGDRGDFTASGVYGQSVHVLPRQNTVVVRLSEDHGTPGAHGEEAMIVGRAIADALQARP